MNDTTTLAEVNPGYKGSTIASAATTNLARATGDFIHVSGTTTITALGTCSAGREIRVVFDGALILTHNATSLILPGAANITTVAGDSAAFISEGSGNWRCVSFTAATRSHTGIGYASGGAVTQITSASTGVTLNALAGQITTVALTTAAAAEEVFTVTNSAVAATDVPVVACTYAGAGTVVVTVKKVAAGSFDIVIANLHASNALNALVVVNFAIVKAAAA